MARDRKGASADFKEAVKRYGDEQREIEKIARQKEHDRDAKSAEGISYSISITGMRLVWQFSKWQSH